MLFRYKCKYVESTPSTGHGSNLNVRAKDTYWSLAVVYDERVLGRM